MNLDQLHSKLMAAARKHPPGGQVPYAFEKRILSRLTARPAPNAWALWAGPLWQAALSCVAVTLLCCFWAARTQAAAESPDNFSQAFEAAVVAPLNDHVEDAW
jgi:hypothetical protein